MSITSKEVKKLFNYLETGENELFFKSVEDKVKWTVMGTHPLAGTYHNKDDFISHTFDRLNKVLKAGVLLKVDNVIVQEDTAVVEMKSEGAALNGKPFNNSYCWVVKFENNKIVEVRAYVDSALVAKVIDENEKE